jgi:putative tryptophan/tyrosine transport system substrate-binding protein
MRQGELNASLAATAVASIDKLAPTQFNVSALARRMRAFGALAVIAVGLVSFAHEAPAQEPVHRIGVLFNVQVPEIEQALRDGLRARGYDVGRNLQIEIRYTQGQFDRIPALVAELVALRPEIIVVAAPQSAVAVHAAAPTIPLVFVGIADPVAIGLVPNLAHPGGHVTGIAATFVPEDFVAKMLQLLKTVTPAASRIAILVNPTNQIHQRQVLKLPETARRLGVELVTVEASRVEEIEPAFQEARARGAEAINVFGDPLATRASAKIASLALQYRWPSIYLFPWHVRDGGLMSYGPSILEVWRTGASHIDKILKGAKPGDLPVEQPTRFDLIINLKTAGALGITVPATLLALAAEVIE